ncbi:hypothetical protein [Deinococcus roseus]|nr:hypothetical protein [Deinococcus roseus]
MKTFQSRFLPFFLVGAALMLPQGQATAFPFGQVLKSGKVPLLAVHADWAGFTFVNRTFQVDFKSHYDNRKINEIRMYFSDRNLTEAQAITISKLAAHIALNCYNLLPERKAVIQEWIASWLILNDVSQQHTFGPLLLDAQHTSSGDALLWFTRTGVPGKSPWVNHCTS